MTFEKQVADAVAAKVASVEGPMLDADELRRRGRGQARRRTAALVVSAAVVVAGTAWAATNLRDDAQSVGPVQLPQVNTDSVRSLAYAEGREIHLGDRVVESEQEPTSLEVTDYGVAFTTDDGAVWFTTGEAPERIGTTDPALAERWGTDPLVSQATGPNLEWFQPDESGGVNVVVYDTRQGKETGRVATGIRPGCSGECGAIYGLQGSRLYWTAQACQEDCRGFPPTHDDESVTEPTPTTRETDLATGDSRLLSSQEFRDVVRAWPRTIELRQGSGKPMDETSDDYSVGDGTGLQLGGWPRIEVAGPAPGELVRFVIATDTPVQFQGKGPRPAHQDFHLTQWLDDDTVAIAEYWFNRDDTQASHSLLLACHLSSRTCEEAAPAQQSGSRVVPGA